MMEIIFLSRCEIKDLIYEFVEDYYSRDFELDALSAKYTQSATVLAAFLDGIAAGFVSFYMNDTINKIAYISMVVVKKRFRHQGIATMLMKDVIQECIINHFNVIRLEVNNSNQKAINMYIGLGFVFESVASDNSTYYRLEILE